MSLVIQDFKKFDVNNDSELEFTEYIVKHKLRNNEKDLVCTLFFEDNVKDITKCSSSADCYDYTAGVYTNDKCANPRESCAAVTIFKDNAPV